MAISDGQFRVVVLAGGAVLALGLGAIRFCGGVALPPASERASAAEPEARAGAHDVRSASAASPAMYQEFLARDAEAAGAATPTLAQMGRKLPYRVDEGRRELEVGARPIEIAGLKIAAVRAGDAVALEIRNATASDLAYRVVSAPAPEGAECGTARPLPLNAMVLGVQQRETRVECAWREQLAILVTRVETLELSPLSAWYVGQVPPTVVGIEDRIARGHRGPDGGGACTSMVPSAVKTGLENGEIGWRDLVDFYARHRCHTYQFPLSYRAFTKDGQHPLPAVDAGG